jgi:hypothetical protein
MQELRTIYSREGRQRVIFYRHADETVGFVEEVWSDEPFENCWLPRQWPDSHCDSLETALREAAGRIEWFDIT